MIKKIVIVGLCESLNVFLCVLSSFSIYLVTVTSQAVGGSTETLCAQIHEPKEPLSIVVTLRTDDRNLTILQQASIKKDFYKCVPFKVPLVTAESVASVDVAVRGGKISLNKTTKILINLPKNLLFIQSDKPIYKPGQTIKIRIVSLDSKFLPRNQVFQTVELEDPYSNRIGQWLNQTTRIGILDLSHSMSPEAAQGYYTINAWDEKNQQISHGFEIKEYVLPKYEVNINFPSVITIQDKEVTLKVCAKYTYGKPVLGSVNAKVCGQDYGYYWRRPLPDMVNVCKTYSMMTDKTGCGSQVINVTEFGLSSGGSFQVNCNVEESGTGLNMKGSTSAVFTSDYISVHFEDTPDTYRPGMAFKGKVVVTNPQSSLMKNEPVVVYAFYGDKKVNVTLTTDINGTARFSFNTSDWSTLPVELWAYHRGGKKRTDFEAFTYYPSSYLYVRPFYSKSKSFLILTKAPEKLSCNSDATVTASYIIQGGALKTGQKTLDFFYIVLSRGSMVQNDRLSVSVNNGKENKGELTFTLKKTAALTPYAQVVVYTVLPNRETVADSMDFPIEECLPNKVSLQFSSPTALPGEKTSLNLKANPGSLCSVRAIDQSVLLLRPEAELDAAAAFRLLPFQSLSGYPYEVDEWEPYPCLYPWEEIIPFAEPARRKRSLFRPYYGNRNDVYNIFRAVGIKIATNSDIKELRICQYGDMSIGGRDVMEDMKIASSGIGLDPNVEKHSENMRKFFPETWIWDLISVGQSGSVDVAKTVPDAITKWAAGAFCTSRVGFGVAPKTNLTAFKPFFVSLALPYSVIREETFTLKATVFNYLPKCIMVKVTLAGSPQFTAQPCKDCTYTQCVCSEESQTFQWISRELCGNEVVTFPDKGRIDTVMQSILVAAEGTKQSISQNEAICVTDCPQETSVSLTLPKVFVKDSAKSFITVLGDLMGRALKNIGDLLAMPYGCGEQNMLNFAPNIYILQYLESSGQLTPEIKKRAITFLQSGYQGQLKYKHYDGSYSAFGTSDPSGNTWLTAFVMKSFGGAKKYIFIDQTNIDQAKNWLKRRQQENGCFASVGKLYHIGMMGGVNDEVTLSAYITAALLELGVQKTDEMVAKSLACLKQSSLNITNTYVTALLSYTFTLAGDEQMRQNLLSKLDKQAKREGVGRYWTLTNNVQPTGSVEVETSAYVLLALLSGPTLPGFGLNYSVGIVHWLTKNQNAYGGFSSTQDTVVALQALAKYSASTYNPEGSITVTVTSPSGQNNQFTFALHYNIPPPPDSLAFKINASTGVCSDTRNPAFTLTTTARYSGTRAETNMVIINVRLLSGYKPDETSLQALREDPTIKRLDLDADHVFFYLDSLKKNQVKSISLQLAQEVPVQNLKPAVVIVYDYYKISIIYLVTVNSQAVGGSTETLCAHVHEPKEPLSIVVTLRTDNRNLTILQQASIKKDYYRCVLFKVPVVTVESVASVDVVIRGNKTSLNKTTKITSLSTSLDKQVIQTLFKFRIVSLDSNFLPRNQMFRTVELQDPYSNRIGQWLNQTTRIGILDLSHSMSPEAAQGYYTINAWDDKNQQISHGFEIKEYVLPKYEVNIDFPSVITNQDKEVTLKVCAKYTYDKPVLGSVNAKVCVQNYNYYYYRPGFPNKHDVCKKYSMMTGKTGCGSQLINVTEFGLSSGGSFQVNCNVEESGTGITMQGSTSGVIIHDYISVHFEDTVDTYRPGMIFKGKVMVTNSQSRPMKNEPVIVYAHYGGKNVNVTLTTDINGTGHFSFNTSDWSEQNVQLQAIHKGSYHYVRPFHSNSKSFLMLTKAPEKLSCNSDATVKISYIIQGSALKRGQKTLNFFYIVLSRGRIVQHGCLFVSVNTGNSAGTQIFYISNHLSKHIFMLCIHCASFCAFFVFKNAPSFIKEIKGELTITLENMTTLAPYAQVVVYTVLPSGENVANYTDIPIQDCLLLCIFLLLSMCDESMPVLLQMTSRFSHLTTLPGEKISLNLKASPGSLCSVRAIDQSLLLLRPEAELDAATVFRKLPVKNLSGCPYNTEEPYTCPYSYFPHYGNRNDIYNIFTVRYTTSPTYYFRELPVSCPSLYTLHPTTIGITIVTNAEVPAVYDIYKYMLKKEPAPVYDVGQLNMAKLWLGFGSNVEKPTQKIRSFSPETWIWDLVPVGKSGSVDIAKTVPDTITTWAAVAFCTSPAGFVVTPKTYVTAFKPFFVSLNLPYSVIREETFTLKATVFNYLTKCIMVKVTLANSPQFTAQPCRGCTYTQCVCSEESQTFQWTVTPSELGKVNITVRAEAVKSQELCGNEVVTLPDKGRIDTVMQSVLVESSFCASRQDKLQLKNISDGKKAFSSMANMDSLWWISVCASERIYNIFRKHEKKKKKKKETKKKEVTK
ncbi:Alpha-2-macroglobulin-like protein 1 [Labeo rohita]|uniref:Alpha-2-macroglobulin-like protein 1 n=1 Tax=Labeo rohita TaxID=84645 RepID=A0ABQ8M2X7_LABRO|nr:Alpha-2-macroglobulin-like protein 1 [Labeo rohita]